MSGEPVFEDTPELSAVSAPAVIESSNDAPAADSAGQSCTSHVEQPAPDAPADLFGTIESRADAGSAQYADFDPAIHVARDGVPVLNKDGTYRMRPGRKPKSTGAEMAPDRVVTPQAPAPQAATLAAAGTVTDNKAVAMVLVTTVTAMAEKVIGPEWVAEKDEVKALSDATRKYLDSIGGLEITPGAALCIAVAGYAMPRLAVENTRSKLATIGDWLRDRYYWMRGKFGGNRRG